LAELGYAQRKNIRIEYREAVLAAELTATWLTQADIDGFEAAGYLGMSVETLLEVYGHHHPPFRAKAAKATGRRR
jgi:hypothetical protein